MTRAEWQAREDAKAAAPRPTRPRAPVVKAAWTPDQRTLDWLHSRDTYANETVGRPKEQP